MLNFSPLEIFVINSIVFFGNSLSGRLDISFSRELIFKTKLFILDNSLSLLDLMNLPKNFKGLNILLILMYNLISQFYIVIIVKI